MILGLGCSILMFLLIKPFLLSATGTFGPTVLQAESPGPAVVAVLVALAAGTAIACLASRLLAFGDVPHEDEQPFSSASLIDPHDDRPRPRSSGTGMLIIGIGLGWTCLQLESVQTVILDGSTGLLAAEGMLWGLLVLLMAATVLRIGGPYVNLMQNDDGSTDHWANSVAAIKLAACGACVLPVVWLIAQSPRKGQVVIATTLGGVAAGLVGRLASPTVQPVLLFPAVCVFGALGQWVTGLWLPSDPAALVAAGQLPAIVLPLPIDYAAGALIGVPIGISWANSFLEKQDSSQSPATT